MKFLFFAITMLFCLVSKSRVIQGLEIEEYCQATNSELKFRVVIDIDYGRTLDKRLIMYEFDCDRVSHSCNAFKVNLTDKKISILDTGTLVGAKISISKGDVHIIEWGPLRTFTLDIAKNTVEYRESGDSMFTGQRVNGSGISKCGKS